MAVYLYNLEKLEAGKPVRHWAGTLADIQAIAKDSKPRAAAKLSRETMIDYGAFTPWENDTLRNALVPFYSWLKKNLTFWPRVFKNAAAEGTAGKPVAAAATLATFNIAKWLVRILGVYGLAYLWNHRDDDAQSKEASLPFWLRSQPHLNVGNYTLWGDTAISDFMEWFGYDQLASATWRYEAGFMGPKETALEVARVIAEAPVNKLYQALNPFPKAAVTAVTGQTTYPSVFGPRFVAPPASKKSLERAIVDVLGADAKKFYETAKGDRALEDTLAAYFAGWWAQPTDPETLAEQIRRTKAWSTLKGKSKTTGRGPGEAKSGKEAEWQESAIRQQITGEGSGPAPRRPEGPQRPQPPQWRQRPQPPRPPRRP